MALLQGLFKGHGTDRALLGGIMGFSTDDMRIRKLLLKLTKVKRPYLSHLLLMN